MQPLAAFGVFQLEMTTTQHYQCYFQWKKAYTLGMCKKVLPTAHWEAAKGTCEENYTYCTKADTCIAGPWEFGTRKTLGGKRSDLADLYKLAKEGVSPKVAAEEMPSTYLRYHKAYAHIQSMYKPPDVDEVGVILVLGPMRTGKTTAIRKNFPDCWTNPAEKATWFDGYHGQETVLFDEYKGHVPLTVFLRLLHGFTESVPVKGGHVWWKPKRIFISSNYHPKDWYDFTTREASRLALFRRITTVYVFDGEEEPVPIDGLDYFGIREHIESIKYFDVKFK